MMIANVLQDAIQGPDLDRIVHGNGNVVLACNQRCGTRVTPLLTDKLIPKASQRPEQIGSGDVPRQFQSASTSSRT